MKYFFYSRGDDKKEPISKTETDSRLSAAKFFAKLKQLPLKTFLKIFGVSKYDR